MTSLTPTGTPLSTPGRPARSMARACAKAGSGSSQTQALTAARASARSRQSRTKVSAVRLPASRRAAASLAVSRSAPLIVASPSRRSTHRPVSSSRASSWRRPTSWIPTGNPSGPCPAGKVRQGMANCVHSALKTAEPVSPSPRGAWPGAGKVRIASKPAGPFACRGARLLGRAAGVAELVEGQLAAERDLLVAQPRAQQGFVAIEFGHVVAQPLERAEGLLDLVGRRRIRAAARCRRFSRRRRRAGRRRLRAPPCPPAAASSQCGPRHRPRRGGVSGIAGGS